MGKRYLMYKFKQSLRHILHYSRKITKHLHIGRQDREINRVRVMLLGATFNNISVISWRSVLLLEENGVPGEYHQPVTSHRQTLSHNVVANTAHHLLDSNPLR